MSAKFASLWEAGSVLAQNLCICVNLTGTTAFKNKRKSENVFLTTVGNPLSWFIYSKLIQHKYAAEVFLPTGSRLVSLDHEVKGQ